MKWWGWGRLATSLRLVVASLAFSVAMLPAATPSEAVVLPDAMIDSPNPDGPTPVQISFYLDDISRIDVFAHNFSVTGQLVLEWRDPRLVPLLAGRAANKPEEYEGAEVANILRRLWHPALEISNEQNQRRTGVRALQLFPNGRVKLYEKFDSLPHLEGDMHLFPFVRAKLRIAFTANLQDRAEMALEGRRFEFQPGENAESIIIGHWSFVSMTTEAKWEKRSDEPDTLYPRNDFVVTVEREVFSGVITFVFPLIMLALVSIPLLWLDPVASPRVGGTLTLILTSVALQITQRSRMPNVHYLTLTDYLFYLTLMMLTVSITLSCVVIYFSQRGMSARAAHVDRMIKIGYPIVFLALALVACLLAVAHIG